MTEKDCVAVLAQAKAARKCEHSRIANQIYSELNQFFLLVFEAEDKYQSRAREQDEQHIEQRKRWDCGCWIIPASIWALSMA